MKYKKLEKMVAYAIKIQKGDDIGKQLEKFAIDNKIKFGQISGIGMAEDLQIGFLKNGEYKAKHFKNGCEIVSFEGNISWVNKKPIIHAHIIISDEKYKTYGGHFISAKCSAVVECMVMCSNGEKIQRKKDTSVSFKTWDI